MSKQKDFHQPKSRSKKREKLLMKLEYQRKLK